MTEQEKFNKKEARRLISLPVSQRPNNVHYKEATRLEYASYMVQLGSIGVYFQHDGKRLYYLGEYLPENFHGGVK